jgi:CubicO group peptidase (beta-lactamase class C family)
VLVFLPEILALVTLAVPAARPRDTGAVVQGPIAERIDRWMTAAADLGLAGTLLVEKDGAVILHKGYGVIDREHGTPADTRTHYLIGSLSKQFTATAIYQLESRGKLKLSDPLSRWFPEAPADKRAITIDQLVHHTAGFPYLPGGGLFDSISVDSMVREILGERLEFEPGARYQYSSPGYNLLAAIIGRASGRSFNDYVRTNLFVPAGMTESGFDDEPSRWPPNLRTPSYGTAERDPPLYPWVLDPKAMGAGSVVTTAADLWKWEQALRGGSVLDTAATRKLFAPGPDVGTNAHYAGGWNVVKSQRNTTVIMHAGDIGGFNADMRRFVDEHATLIFISNGREGGRGYREAVALPVTRLLFGPPIELPPARMKTSPALLARWRGTWLLAADAPVEGRVKGDTVWVLAKTQAAMSALAGSDSAARADERSLTELAAAVADTLVRGDSTALVTRAHPSIGEEGRLYLFRLWARTRELVGQNPTIAVLGTARTAPNAARSYVAVRGSQGSRIVSLDWVRGLLIDTSPVPQGGLELRFYAERPDTLARLDLWNGRVIRIAKSDARRASSSN